MEHKEWRQIKESKVERCMRRSEERNICNKPKIDFFKERICTVQYTSTGLLFMNPGCKIHSSIHWSISFSLRASFFFVYGKQGGASQPIS